MSDYNYAIFDMEAESSPFAGFPALLGVGQQAPSFPLEDLDSGGTVEMAALWEHGPAVIEFGSFT